MGGEAQKEYLTDVKKNLDSLKNTIEENIKLISSEENESSSIDIAQMCLEHLYNSINYIDIIIDKSDSELFFPNLYLNIFLKRLNALKLNEVSKDKLNASYFFDVYDSISKIKSELSKEVDSIKRIEKYKESTQELDTAREERKALSDKLNELNILIDDQKNKQIHKIFEDDSKKFKLIAATYEITFYLIVVVLICYFLGLTFYVSDFKFSFIEAGFPEKIHGKLSPEFYIQKISLLILSTTLAAFLLKRSFMNRRLADDAYRTSKELVALPRYIEGLPNEMKEKIRFDLAYKYFGNGIHHESYTGGENLMHENIKANTDFIKAVKDLTPKVEVSKTEVAKEDKAPKDAA